jgi:outer membrane protein OmpA-like peptidoglycan-associated protein
MRMRMSALISIAALLLITQAAFALPSFMGYRGINRVVDARPVGEGEIMFGLMVKYWASTDNIEAMPFNTFGPTYSDTLDVADKEHYADGLFVVGYGLTNFMELGARLCYSLSYYERDMIQPRGLIPGRWDGIDGLGDARIGMKLGFTPTPSNELLWLGMQNWWSFAPNTNQTVVSEDYDGRWYDGMPMYEMRRPTLSTGHTSFGVGGLVSLDFAKIAPSTPIRFHTNVGWSSYSQTFDMTDFRYSVDSTQVTFSDSTPVHLSVDDNVLDVNVGLEFPTRFAIPFVEYSLQEYMDREGNQSVAYISPGLRFITTSGAFMDITFDLGLTDYNYQYFDLGHALYQGGPVSDEDRLARTPLPGGGTNDWGVGFSLAFSSDLIKPFVAPTEGRVSGMITSSVDGTPVAGTLTFPGTTIPNITPDATGFYTVTVPAGSIPMTVTADGYQPSSATIVIEGGQSMVKDFSMIPVPPNGMVAGSVTASETGDPIAATVSVTGAPQPLSVTCTADGVYQISVPAGTWTIKAEANGFLPKTQAVVVSADGTTVVNFELRPALVQGQVLRFNNIYFDVASANIKPESYPVLDGIVATLLENPNARVQIAGHCDSDGSSDYNQTLSEQRAASVFNYLVNRGVSARNLTSIGFGESQPIVPNTSAANKAQNRRIEFTVLSTN